jgi:putative hemolysin
MTLLLQTVFLIFCIAASSLFAGMETGFVSWNPLKLSHRAMRGDIVARWADFLMRHKDRLLSAVLIGNNVAIISASLVFKKFLESLDHAYSLELSNFPLAETLMLTPIMVLFGEMLPKSLFRLYPFRLTMHMTPPLMAIYYVTLPFTSVFSFFTDFLRKNKIPEGETYMAKVREEMVMVAQEGSASGTLFRSADKFIRNLMEINSKTIGEMYRSIVSAASSETGPVFDSSLSVGEVKECLAGQKVVLVGDHKTQIAGKFVALNDLVSAPDTAELGEISRPLHFVTGENSIIALLQEGSEYGTGVIGIIDHKGEYVGASLIDSLLLTALSFQETTPKPDK